MPYIRGHVLGIPRGPVATDMPPGCSIFAPRRKEADSRSFWDTDRVVRKALDADYGRMLKEDRVLRLISKSDTSVATGQKAAKESLEEVSAVGKHDIGGITGEFALYTVKSCA